MRTLPALIKVGPYAVTVRTDAEAVLEMKRQHPDFAAMMDLSRQRITVDQQLGPDVLAEAVLHEVQHAIDSAVGIDPEATLIVHELIYRTTAMFLLVLRDNPDLVSYLVGPSTEAFPSL